MNQYIGTKIIKATPMDEADYRRERGMSEYAANRKGYKVEYQDGYISWCPKEAFEEAYRPTNGMQFGLAIEALKNGKKVRRSGWNGAGIFLELQTPDEHSKMSFPYIFIDTRGLVTNNPDAPKGRVPWLASQTDMLCDDWMIVTE